jgi:6-phosphogluconolactonase/glucosamine-6-phosphate isomerase/deaminase
MRVFCIDELCRSTAVTPGLATIMAAREVVVLVSGTTKREPLRRLLTYAPGPDVPASVLSLHPRSARSSPTATRVRTDANRIPDM